MNDVREMLRRGDPLAHEPWPDHAAKAGVRARISSARTAPVVEPTSLRARRVVVGLLSTAVLLGALWQADVVPSLTTPAFAAVRFEVRLAEEDPGPSLREGPVGTTQRIVYLHDEVVVSNADVASAVVVPGSGGDRFGVELRLGGPGAARMREATRRHLGRPVALLIDGYVIVAPTVRSEIGDTARLSGDYTRAEAERIVRGVTLQ